MLSVGTESGEPTRVEVDLIHETLLAKWDRLQQAIAERRPELRQRVRFEQQLKEWLGQNRSDDYLLGGVRLAEARELERRADIALHNAEAKDFVRLSSEREEIQRQKELADARRLAEVEKLRAASERQRAEEQTQSSAQLRRRAVYLIGALGVAVLLGIIAGLFGFQSNQAASNNATLAAQNANIAATAQAASTKAVSEANIRATAESPAIEQRDKAQGTFRIVRSS